LDKNGPIRVWALSRVEDTNGNYYTVDYMVEDGEYYPVRIIYTQGDGISKYRVIDFEYEERGDFWDSYDYASRVVTKKRLKEIVALVDVPSIFKYPLTIFGSTSIRYVFQYIGGSNFLDFSYLTSLTESINYNTPRIMNFKWNNITPGSNGDISSINGDGRMDYVVVWGSPRRYLTTYIAKPDGTFQNGVSTLVDGTYLADASGRDMGNFVDVNGDGRMDYVVVWGSPRRYLTTYIGKPDGTFQNGVSTLVDGTYLADASGRDMGNFVDVNGDGRMDYVVVWGSPRRYLTTYIAKPDGTFQNGVSTLVDGTYLADASGRDMGEFAEINNNSKRYLISISDPMGSIIDITYNNALNINNAIIPSTSNYPIISNKSTRLLVTSITISDGRGSSYKKEYNYKNGKIYTGFPQDRKNLYFESITETDTSTGIKTVTYYEQDDPWLAGTPICIESSYGAQTIKKDIYNYNVNATATQYTGTHSAKLQNQITTTYEKGIAAFSQSKTFTYDSYGNPTNIVDHSDDTSDIVTAITYDSNETTWILNRPLEVTKTSGGKIIDGKKYAYTNNKLSGMSAYLDTASGWIPTSYTADSCGNITSTTDSLGRTTTIQYDSDYNSFIAKVTNPLGQSVSMTYDAATGNPVSKTDQNGNTSRNTYDGSGRMISATNAEGEVIKEIDYHDELRGNANAQYIETKIHNDSSLGYSWSQSYYDGLGREYKSISNAGTLNSAAIVQIVDTVYNSAGQVSSKTLPYILNKQTPLSVIYTYDYAGKVIKEVRPGNIIVNTDYTAVTGGILVTKTDPKGNASTATYNSRGRLVKKTEPAGAQVLYSYDGAGRLVRTVDAGNLATNIAYDSFGRKTSISDPNTGTTLYSYDNAGNLVSKTDAIGNTITYSYDSINRLIKTDFPDGTPDVLYNYDESSSANGKGRVTSVTAGASSTKYAYDANGNVTYLRQNVENIDFIFTMDYDTQNRMTALTYPDGTKIDREYSENGYLKAVKQGTGAYVQYALKLDGTGAFKNTVRRVTGNGVDTAIAYDPATMRPMAIETRDKNNTLLERNEYTYDPSGNITKINNLFDPAKTQDFEYDSLNRLTKAKGLYGTAKTEQNFTYNPAGNLTKNNHGDMVYGDSTHPYAVTADGDGNSYSYDANGNMISGRGRDMAYDAAGRLVSLKKNGTEIQKNKYDHAGHRLVQQRADGTIIYNINGLYELVKAPNRPDHHTKYIYGMEGDIAAQVTTTGTSLVGANFGNGFIFDKGYGSNPFTSVLAKGYIKADKFFAKAKNILKVQYALVILLFAALSGALLKSGITRRVKKIKGYAQPLRSSAMSLMLVIAIIGSFSLTGCDEIITGITSSDGGGNGTTVTTDTGGLPTVGTYYFHPDHIGSVSYLTDSNGAVVTRMSYTPYGEKVKSASTGPDIFHQKYTGQVDDGEESGLMYYNARYYDPMIGRFISADTVIPDASYSQSFNRYMYVKGNPVNFNDPTGHWPSIGGVFHKLIKKVLMKRYDNAVHNVKEHIKNGWDNTKNTVGNKDWWKDKWHDNQWLRITTYVLITVAVIALAVFLGPEALGGIGFVTQSMLIGALIGATVGFVYGGAINGGWNWENAFKGMAIGAIIGAVIGLCIEYAPAANTDAEVSAAKGATVSDIPGSLSVYSPYGDTVLASSAPASGGVTSVNYFGVYGFVGSAFVGGGFLLGFKIKWT